MRNDSFYSIFEAQDSFKLHSKEYEDNIRELYEQINPQSEDDRTVLREYLNLQFRQIKLDWIIFQNITRVERILLPEIRSLETTLGQTRLQIQRIKSEGVDLLEIEDELANQDDSQDFKMREKSEEIDALINKLKVERKIVLDDLSSLEKQKKMVLSKKDRLIKERAETMNLLKAQRDQDKEIVHYNGDSKSEKERQIKDLEQKLNALQIKKLNLENEIFSLNYKESDIRHSRKHSRTSSNANVSNIIRISKQKEAENSQNRRVKMVTTKSLNTEELLSLNEERTSNHKRTLTTKVESKTEVEENGETVNNPILTEHVEDAPDWPGTFQKKQPNILFCKGDNRFMTDTDNRSNRTLSQRSRGGDVFKKLNSANRISFRTNNLNLFKGKASRRSNEPSHSTGGDSAHMNSIFQASVKNPTPKKEKEAYFPSSSRAELVRKKPKSGRSRSREMSEVHPLNVSANRDSTYADIYEKRRHYDSLLGRIGNEEKGQEFMAWAQKKFKSAKKRRGQGRLKTEGDDAFGRRINEIIHNEMDQTAFSGIEEHEEYVPRNHKIYSLGPDILNRLVDKKIVSNRVEKGRAGSKSSLRGNSKILMKPSDNAKNMYKKTPRNDNKGSRPFPLSFKSYKPIFHEKGRSRENSQVKTLKKQLKLINFDDNSVISINPILPDFPKEMLIYKKQKKKLSSRFMTFNPFSAEKIPPKSCGYSQRMMTCSSSAFTIWV